MPNKKPLVPETAISIIAGLIALIAFSVLVILLDTQSSSPTSRPDKLWIIEKWALATVTIAFGMVWFARFVKRIAIIERNFYIEIASIFVAAFASAFLLT